MMAKVPLGNNCVSFVRTRGAGAGASPGPWPWPPGRHGSEGKRESGARNTEEAARAETTRDSRHGQLQTAQAAA